MPGKTRESEQAQWFEMLAKNDLPKINIGDTVQIQHKFSFRQNGAQHNRKIGEVVGMIKPLNGPSPIYSIYEIKIGDDIIETNYRNLIRI